MIIDYLLKITRAIFYGYDMNFFFIIFNCINDSVIFIKELSVSFITILTVNDTLRMYKNDDIRMYNFNCITDTIVEVITTCNTYTQLTVHLL